MNMNASYPRVSIIIPCYNLGRYIEEALDSILNQTFQDFEVIIVDDGSTDEETRRILQGIHEKKTRIYFKENGGVSSARNFGIKESKGEYICCLDSDDRYHPDFLEKCVSLFEESSEKLGIITTWTRIFGKKSGSWKTSEYKPEHIGFANGVHTASMFKKLAWEECGGYNEKMSGYEDWDLWVGIVGEGYSWDVIPEELFLYRVREGSKVTKSNRIQGELYSKIVRGRRKYFDKYYPDILEQFKNEQIGNRNTISYLEESQKEKAQAISSLTQTVEQKDQEIQQVNAQIQEANARIEMMELSKFWKLRGYWEGVKWGLKNLRKFVGKYFIGR